ncbi:ABC-type dipeptide/oligopeptide/nickel transport system, permease component [Mesorhizobium australicum WSM2073]|uniref:ABC-type dipeptide/oligopeptide/nickel transport system, permease component n=3 Tax=Mesorhizobium TaxID=68287 RepID=L0KVN1_MESAW|nr:MULTISPECIES: ABC transporter permease [Mesorhizobium]ADV14775.1 binding-protein-dependent transport systems inner membrane component [Mesorhizobium ciceri biovar biserrulae WSM1271]AEH90662.1 binding-protein-dependent transport systems inner membrane component [Mesorhizobium opportunistum WSM2075]AGB48034.1 ABC-type dipeptide/oligopeptide/nickel transport system, permease component [Mesorhizobium australicum WSM2073]OBP89876.1 peptide ABC transporter [Mesorhizobium loti]
MAAYILRRFVSTIAVMAMVGIFIFLLLRLARGDPAAMIAGRNAAPQLIASIREHLGLNDPMPVQFMRWVRDMLGGDFGTSIFAGRPVLDLISQRLEPTLSLSILTMILSVSVGVSFGILAAWRSGGLLDRLLAAFSAVGYSVPVFVIGYFLIYFFAIRTHWLPVQGYIPLNQGLGPWFVHLILPTVALGLGYIAFIARVTRASMLEVLSEDYMRTAAAKGASSYAMLFHHALKNAGVPILTVIGISFAYLIGGVVLTETVFNIPGIGRLVVDAINNRDYPIIQSVLILTSGLYVLINLTVDLAYTLIDPRIRY